MIYNDAGQILVVKEIDRTYWDLPGGGMDFGETIESSLKRELLEEVGYKGGLRYQLFERPPAGLPAAGRPAMFRMGPAAFPAWARQVLWIFLILDF